LQFLPTLAFLALRAQPFEQNFFTGEQKRRRFTGPPQNSQHPNACGSHIFPNFTGLSSSSIFCSSVVSTCSLEGVNVLATEVTGWISAFSSELTVSAISSITTSAVTGSLTINATVSGAGPWLSSGCLSYNIWN